MNTRREIGISNYLFPALVISLAAVGCAGQTPQAHDARAAGEWTFRLPQTRSPYADLAVAQGGQPTSLAMVDDALASTPAPSPTQPAPKMRPAPQPRQVLAKAEAQPAPQPIAAMPEPVAAAPSQPEQLALNTPAATDPNEELRYSQRDQQSQKQREFRGGDAIVISASALVIILLVIILILLLT